MKNHCYKLDPKQWLSDRHLRCLSLAARGLWCDLIAWMLQLERPGYLQHAGKPLTPAQIARLCGEPLPEVRRLLGELDKAGVLTRDETGAIYCRQLVREAEQRDKATARKRRQRGSVTP